MDVYTMTGRCVGVETKINEVEEHEQIHTYETRLKQQNVKMKHIGLGGGFKDFLFSPLTLGKIPILTNIFQIG